MAHIPTGIVVTSQDERSQHRNAAMALESLHERTAAKTDVEDAEKYTCEKRTYLQSAVRYFEAGIPGKFPKTHARFQLTCR